MADEERADEAGRGVHLGFIRSILECIDAGRLSNCRYGSEPACEEKIETKNSH